MTVTAYIKAEGAVRGEEVVYCTPSLVEHGDLQSDKSNEIGMIKKRKKENPPLTTSEKETPFWVDIMCDPWLLGNRR